MLSHTYKMLSHTHKMSSHTHKMLSHTHKMLSHTHKMLSHTHKMSSHTHKIRTEMSKIYVANFFSGLFTHKTHKAQPVNTSAVATPATLNAPALSTVFEIPRWSVHCNGPTIATLVYQYCSLIQGF